MKVLYIGGTGEISYCCVAESARAGHEVTVFNRGQIDEPLPNREKGDSHLFRKKVAVTFSEHSAGRYARKNE